MLFHRNRSFLSGVLVQTPSSNNHEEYPILPIGGDGGHFLLLDESTQLHAADVVTQPPNHSALLFRQIVQAAGTVARHLAFLVPAAATIAYAEQAPRQPDHSNGLIFRQTTPSAASATQPYWLHRGPQRLSEDEGWRSGSHDGLHALRRTYQTVGQPFWTLQQPARRVDSEPQIQATPDHGALHRLRTTYQTVGQPLWLFQPPASQRAVAEELRQVNDYSALLFRQTVPGTAAATYQPLFRWPQFVGTVEPEQITPVPSAGLFAYRWPQIVATFQPLLRFPRFVGVADAEPQIKSPDHSALHRFRTGYQTVGQSWLLWPKAPRLPDADDLVPAPTRRTLLELRSAQFIALQPLLRWPTVVAREWAWSRDERIWSAPLMRSTAPAGSFVPWVVKTVNVRAADGIIVRASSDVSVSGPDDVRVEP